MRPPEMMRGGFHHETYLYRLPNIKIRGATHAEATTCCYDGALSAKAHGSVRKIGTIGTGGLPSGCL